MSNEDNGVGEGVQELRKQVGDNLLSFSAPFENGSPWYILQPATSTCDIAQADILERFGRFVSSVEALAIRIEDRDLAHVCCGVWIQLDVTGGGLRTPRNASDRYVVIALPSEE